MIYLISNQKSLFETDLYQEMSFKDAKEYLWELNTIQFDTETTGLDVFTKPLLCYQLGHKANQFVFDQSSYSINSLKDLFESENKLFLGHNLLFDTRYLYYYDIWIKHLYDTMIAEELIWLGTERRAIDPDEYEEEGYKFPYLIKKRKQEPYDDYYEYSCALNAVGKNRLGIELDKSVRGMIAKVGLTPRVVQYAGTDVMYLEDIKDSQMIDITRENLGKAVDLENEFVKVLAYMEFCGVKLDVSKWKAKMAKDKAKLDDSISKLNNVVLNYFETHNGNISKKTISEEHIVDTQWVHDEETLKKFNIKLYNPSKNPKKYYTKRSDKEELGILYCEEVETPYPYVSQDLQGDLWGGFNTAPYCNLNWSSSKQIIPFFELMGFNMEIFDKKEKRKKKSAAAEVVKSQSKIFPELADAYVQFKKAEKVCDSFGEKWIKAINPVTGRIHADFHQIGTVTSRLSSGGGDSAINVQQIPREAETRACFIAEKGNLWISEDYQSQESRLLASVANDAAMLHIYDPGECADMHALVAYMSYPNIIPRDTKIADIADKYKSARQDAKSIEFCIIPDNILYLTIINYQLL